MTMCAGPVNSYIFEYVRPFLDWHYLNFVLTLPAPMCYAQILYQQ